MTSQTATDLSVRGGLGVGAQIDDRTPGKDLRLMRRAIRNDWPMNEAVRRDVVEALHEFVTDSTNSVRDRVGAAKGLMSADTMNIKRESMDQADVHKQTPDIHVHTIVCVIEDESWYGNEAHNKASETIESPNSHSAIAVEVQGGGLRPSLGEDGDGLDDGD